MKSWKFFLLLMFVVIIIGAWSALTKQDDNSYFSGKAPQEIYEIGRNGSVIIVAHNPLIPSIRLNCMGFIVTDPVCQEPFIISAGHCAQDGTFFNPLFFAVFPDQQKPEPLDLCLVDRGSATQNRIFPYWDYGLDFSVFKFRNKTAANQAIKKALRLGKSSQLKIGDPVYNISVYQEAEYVFNTGRLVHNQLNSNWENRPQNLLTDAIINFGSSGGPLLNKSGEVVGINIGIYGGSNSPVRPAPLYEVVPIDDVKKELESLNLNQKFYFPLYFTHPLCRQIQFINSWEKTDFDLLYLGIFNRPEKETVLVSGVSESYFPAAKLLFIGDEVISIDNQEVNTALDAYRAIFFSLKKEVSMTIKRRGVTLDVAVELIDYEWLMQNRPVQPQTPIINPQP